MADNLTKIECPACGKEMVKVYVKSAGINVDVCVNGCGGVFFDNKEFFAFDENHENICEITKALEGKMFNTVDTTLIRTCPVCGGKMVKNYANFSKTVEVDDCYNCGGKFLDYGELEKIRSDEMKDSERKKDFVKRVYGSADAVEAINAVRPSLKKRSFMKRIFDGIFFGK